MKKFYIFIFFLTLGLHTNAQSIKRSAIGAAGKTLNEGSTSVQSIVGQSSLTINRQGFIQPPGEAVVKPSREVTAYPNPTKSSTFLSGVAKGDMIRLTTLTGVLVEQFECSSFERQEIRLNDLPNGAYLISIEGVFEYNPVKIIKVD